MTPKSLRAKRQKTGTSQSLLSKKSKVSRFKISQYELGYSELKKEEKQKLKKELDKC